MPTLTVEVTADNQELVPAKTGLQIKLLGFWYSVPISHSIGIRGGQGEDPHAVVVTDQNNAFHGGLIWSAEIAAEGCISKKGKSLNAYFVGAGTVWVTILYKYIRDPNNP